MLAPNSEALARRTIERAEVRDTPMVALYFIDARGDLVVWLPTGEVVTCTAEGVTQCMSL